MLTTLFIKFLLFLGVGRGTVGAWGEPFYPWALGEIPWPRDVLEPSRLFKVVREEEEEERTRIVVSLAFLEPRSIQLFVDDSRHILTVRGVCGEEIIENRFKIDHRIDWSISSAKVKEGSLTLRLKKKAYREKELSFALLS